MCCHVRRARVSRRQRPRRFNVSPSPPLAMLDLGKSAERDAHDFLLRATSQRDCMWRLLDMRRQGDKLLCIVRWVHGDEVAEPFSLAEVSLIERAVCWRDYVTVEATRAELARRCDQTTQQDGALGAS